MITIRPATQDDHKALLAIAKQHRCTRDFSNFMFSGPAAYEKGWIRVAVNEHGAALGFTCVRHKSRSPETMLYYLAVSEILRSVGIGGLLMADLELSTPHKLVALNVLLDNPRAIAFYQRRGYTEAGPALKGEGIRMEKRL